MFTTQIGLGVKTAEHDEAFRAAERVYRAGAAGLTEIFNKKITVTEMGADGQEVARQVIATDKWIGLQMGFAPSGASNAGRNARFVGAVAALPGDLPRNWIWGPFPARMQGEVNLVPLPDGGEGKVRSVSDLINSMLNSSGRAYLGDGAVTRVRSAIGRAANVEDAIGRLQEITAVVRKDKKDDRENSKTFDTFVLAAADKVTALSEARGKTIVSAEAIVQLLDDMIATLANLRKEIAPPSESESEAESEEESEEEAEAEEADKTEQ
jgi:hypothetical protein